MLVGLWVTTSCNLKCTYCYEGVDKKHLIMDLTSAMQAVNFIKAHFEALEDDTLIIQFHGGEPLINMKIIKYVVDAFHSYFTGNEGKVLFGITTNAVLLDEETTQYFVKNMTYDFSISIDGDRETHDLYRRTIGGDGTYDMVIKNALMALQYTKDIRVRMTVNTNTVHRLYENIKHLIELGFRKIVSGPDYFDDWNDDSKKVLLEQMVLVRKMMMEHGLYEKDFYVSILEDTFFKKTPCTGGKTSIHIHPDGSVYPCSYGVGEEEYCIGNIFDKPPINPNKLNRLCSIAVTDNEECKGCSNYECCIGTRCKIIYHVMTGNYNIVKASICAIENVKYQFFYKT